MKPKFLIGKIEEFRKKNSDEYITPTMLAELFIMVLELRKEGYCLYCGAFTTYDGLCLVCEKPKL